MTINLSGGESSPKSGRSLSPVPPRTPRDRSRSRSRSPYRFNLSSRATHPRITRKESDDVELAPWDFPNSLRCHPAPAATPQRRGRGPVKQQSLDIDSVPSLESSDIKHQQSTEKDFENHQGNKETHHESMTAGVKSKMSACVSNGARRQSDNEFPEVHWKDALGVSLSSSEDELEFDSSELPHRHSLPDSSDIFQQTLDALRKRGSRSSSACSGSSATGSDPGDLHVSRASIVASQMPSIKDDDAFVDDLETVEEDKEVDRFEKVKRIRQHWITTIKNVLEYTKETRKRKAALSSNATGVGMKCNSLSDAAMLLVRSKSARRKVSKESLPTKQSKISLKAAYHLTKFITAACASTAVGGDDGKSTHLLSREVTRLPEICNNGRMMQRQRRDSLRLVRYMVEEEDSDLLGSTEIATFKELQNCRYLRTSQRQRMRRRRDCGSGGNRSLDGYNEI